MAYWLLKSEPDAFSWDELVKRGPKGDRGPASATTPPSSTC